MILVLATREGLPGKPTASGFLIDAVVPFVALPSTAALRQWVRLYNPTTKLSCRALVLDVGPWNVADHGYVFQPATTEDHGLGAETPGAVRPQAETGTDSRGRPTNKAGIDLSERVRTLLGCTQDNEMIGWEFD